MIAADFRRLLIAVMREQDLSSRDAAALCGVAYPIFVQLLQGPTTTDLMGAERILSALGVGLRLERMPLRREVHHTIIAQNIIEES